jgi:hypothetical protein
MNVAQSLYDQGQKLLALSWECRDEDIAAAMRTIAHAILDTAYAQDQVVEVPRAACG